MSITAIHFTKRITSSHIPIDSWDIPVEDLAVETMASYDHIDDFETMMLVFGRVDNETKYIAETTLKRLNDNQEAIDNAKPGEEPEEIDYDDLVAFRDAYLLNADLDTLVRAYREANGGVEYCTYEYITDDDEDEE